MVSRLTGGRHGYGAKLTAIFSTHFEIDIDDGYRCALAASCHSIGVLAKLIAIVGRRYQQSFDVNLTKLSTPKIHEGGKQIAKLVRVLFNRLRAAQVHPGASGGR